MKRPRRRTEAREDQRRKSADQNEGQFGMFPARGASQVAPSRDDQRDYRGDEKDRVEKNSISVQRDRRRRTRQGSESRRLQKEVGLAKDDYSDGTDQPDAGTAENIPPALVPMPDGKTQEIQHRQIERAGDRSLSDRELSHSRVGGRQREMKRCRATPRSPLTKARNTG